MTEAHKLKMQEARKAAAANKAANPGQPSAAGTGPIVVKPLKASKTVAAKLRIPRNTPVAALQGIVEGMVSQLVALGQSVTTVCGTLRGYK